MSRAERSMRLSQNRSDGSNVLGLGAFLAARHVELDLLAVLEFAVSASFDGGVVDEDVGTALVLLDESESLVGVEPLDGTGGHG